jgi:hypothetical protein
MENNKEVEGEVSPPGDTPKTDVRPSIAVKKKIFYPKPVARGSGRKSHHHKRLNFRVLKVPENRRSYIYPNNDRLIIEGVKAVAVADSGNHRVVTTTDEKYIVRSGWLGIKIEGRGDWEF